MPVVTDKNQTAQNRKDKNRKFAMEKKTKKKRKKSKSFAPSLLLCHLSVYKSASNEKLELYTRAKLSRASLQQTNKKKFQASVARQLAGDCQNLVFFDALKILCLECSVITTVVGKTVVSAPS